MNHWARMLRAMPTLQQRLIARTHRISLPRGCTADQRHVRLRQALCRAATVRAVYTSLEPSVQDALQTLRTLRGGMAPAVLEQRYGAIRPWHRIATDPQPQTISERLLLLGWICLRPAAPRHPPRYLLPPELRRWLPQPLPLPAAVDSPPLPLVPAQRAATTMLLACAERPLDLRADRTPRCATIRLLTARLAPMSAEVVIELSRWLIPLLADLGLIAPHGGAAMLTPAGQHFLMLTPYVQLERLRQAWIAAPRPDRWLMALRVDQRGIDWPLLRRRLCDWAARLPSDCQDDPVYCYKLLSATYGPLADAHTHGFRHVDRSPWQPRRAAAIFEVALRGPLTWLGLARTGRLGWWNVGTFGETPVDVESVEDVLLPTPDPRPLIPDRWLYGAIGEVVVPHGHAPDAVLRLLPFAQWRAADAAATTYAITPASLAHAVGQGWSSTALWALLEDHAGSLPEQWRTTFPPAAQVGVRIMCGAVVLADPPALLDRVLRTGSVRQHVTTRLAPGVALVAPEQAEPLARALQRRGVVAHVDAVPTTVSDAPPDGLSAGECAALLTACAFYRRHAPAGAPLLPDLALEQRLSAALPPRLRTATATVLAELAPPAPPSAIPAPGTRASLGATLDMLCAALAACQAIDITYDTGGNGAWTRRSVRPLAIEQRGESWFLRAYCTTRQMERVFRIDRIGSCAGTSSSG